MLRASLPLLLAMLAPAASMANAQVANSVTKPAHEVLIDTRSAHAVLAALANAELSEEQARTTARLHGNQMLIRKGQEFSDASTEERFVAELLASARRQSLAGESRFAFDSARDRRGTIAGNLAAIEGDRAHFIRWIGDRVSAYSPPGAPLRLEGYLVVGGSSTGFAFGGPDFYLNLAHFGMEPTAVKVNTAHELYHGIHGAAIERLGLASAREFDEGTLSGFSDRAARNRYVVEHYLLNLAGEGIATYVGDPILLTEDGPNSQFGRAQMRQLQNPARLTALLDVALAALTADTPVPYQVAHRVGYDGPEQPLYFLGYSMAKAVAERHGAQRLGELITGTGCGFMAEYRPCSC